MPQIRLSKAFRWEMGHRLPGHPLCGNVHGHSYRMIIEIVGEPNPTTGMVLDYADLSLIVDPLVDQMDHSFMCDPEDQAMRTVLTDNNLKITEVPFRSTAENICVWVADQIEAQLNALQPDLSLSELVVTVCETEKTTATVIRSLVR